MTAERQQMLRLLQDMQRSVSQADQKMDSMAQGFQVALAEER